MRKLSFTCIVLIACFTSLISCKNRNRNAQLFDSQVNSAFLSSEHYDKFKYHGIAKFEIDTIQFGERSNYYQQVDTAMLALIFKKGIPMHEVWLYHATFKDTTLITLLEESDEFGPIIWLVKFDEKGVFSDKTIIAMGSGDAGDTWHRIGAYDNDSTFMVTSIYKIWNASKTKAVNIDTTYNKVTIDRNMFKKVPILGK
jgi:hypothetical protein